MFETVLVANRGEIARRVVRTCHRLGVKAVTVHSEADAGALHVVESDESVLLGPAPPAESYLDVRRVVEAARQTGAQAVHPGYGFLAEDPAFARAVEDAGLVWVGPSPQALERLGDKVACRALAEELGLPLAPAAGPYADAEAALAAADGLGLPLVVKAVRSRGGRGTTVAHDRAALRRALEEVGRTGPVLLERLLAPSRHVEVQLLGLADGRVVALGERDCSVQRRLQKVVEEQPAAGLPPAVRTRLLEASLRLGEAAGLRGAATVEFLVLEGDREVFLEVNPRLQAEHPVTELVLGVDLVEQQLRIAAGQEPSYDLAAVPRGHALELRVYAEDPVRFTPSPGRLTRWVEPEGVRVDSGYREGDEVTPWYDPLLAKVAVHGDTREQALAAARRAVDAFVVEGVRTNLPFLAGLLADEAFAAGHHDTGVVDRVTERRGA